VTWLRLCAEGCRAQRDLDGLLERALRKLGRKLGMKADDQRLASIRLSYNVIVKAQDCLQSEHEARLVASGKTIGEHYAAFLARGGSGAPKDLVFLHKSENKSLGLLSPPPPTLPGAVMLREKSRAPLEELKAAARAGDAAAQRKLRANEIFNSRRVVQVRHPRLDALCRD
jgi:hypothetical protein